MSEMERSLHSFVLGESPPAVGASLITCSDESEHECAEIFHRDFVRALVPPRMFDDRSAFRQATLGGRYEWGAARVSESHYALARGAQDWKLMVLKLNAHVGMEVEGDTPTFGKLSRYEGRDAYCGALHALMAGDTRPFARDLAEVFGEDGLDRVGALNDSARVDGRLRALFAAVANARLQARRAMIDVQDHEPGTPTLTVVLPCVTINRLGKDTEVLVGIYTCDRRGDKPHDEYCGLGDDPAAYRFRFDPNGFHITDENTETPRVARDHRALARAALRERGLGDARTSEQVSAALREQSGDPREGLRAALQLARSVAAEPAALALFATGAAGIHHAPAARNLTRGIHNEHAASMIVDEVLAGLEGLDQATITATASLLVEASA